MCLPKQEQMFWVAWARDDTERPQKAYSRRKKIDLNKVLRIAHGKKTDDSAKKRHASNLRLQR